MIFVLGLSLVFYIMGKYHIDYPFKKKIMNTLEPALYYSNAFIRESRETLWALLHFYRLKGQTEELTHKLEDVQRKLSEYNEMQKENDRLNELLGFKSQLKFRVIPAKIIGQDSSNWKKSVLINKGTDDGVLPNHAVLCPKGIVGKVVESFKTSAKVMLLLDNESQVGGMILRTRDIGVLQGQDKEFCVLNYLSRNADVRKGDLVITSGFEGFFPKGIILGEVEKVYSEDFGLYKYAEIVPTVDFSKLEEVLVIKTHLAPKNSQ